MAETTKSETFTLGGQELEVLRDWQAHTGTQSLYWALVNALYRVDAIRTQAECEGAQPAQAPTDAQEGSA